MTTLATPGKAVQFEMSLSDYHAMQRYVCKPSTADRLLWVVAVFMASFGLALFGRSGRAAVAGMVAGFLIMLVKALLVQHRLQPRPGGAVLGHYELVLTENGVSTQSTNWKSEITWRGILAVEETPAHCFLRLDTASVHTVPKRAFPTGEATQQFIDFARERLSHARSAGKPAPGR